MPQQAKGILGEITSAMAGMSKNRKEGKRKKQNPPTLPHNVGDWESPSEELKKKRYLEIL